MQLLFSEEYIYSPSQLQHTIIHRYAYRTSKATYFFAMFN